MNNHKRHSISTVTALAVMLALACPACGFSSESPTETKNTLPAVSAAYTKSADIPSPTIAPIASPEAVIPAAEIINRSGNTLETRFRPPMGYERIPAEAGSFAEYLRMLPLRSDGASVKYYDGTEKLSDAHCAVVDMDIGGKDLQQCADTVLRLYSEYLYERQAYDRITFHFVSGFEFSWNKWRKGYRVNVDGNDVTWVKTAAADSGRKAFDAYLIKLYTYASTRSMAHSDLKNIEPSELAIGDMFIKGGSPGHVVLVADMAIEPDTGKKCFMLLQGYMPAQDVHILCNLDEPEMSPWVTLPVNPSGEFVTPEYVFTWEQTMRFKR